jgi:hypothetical protein
MGDMGDTGSANVVSPTAEVGAGGGEGDQHQQQTSGRDLPAARGVGTQLQRPHNAGGESYGGDARSGASLGLPWASAVGAAARPGPRLGQDGRVEVAGPQVQCALHQPAVATSSR